MIPQRLRALTKTRSKPRASGDDPIKAVVGNLKFM